VVALARARRDLHLAQQRVHLGDRQDPPGADRAVAGDGRGDMVEPVAQAQRPPSSASSAARSASSRGRRSCRAAPGSRGPASRSARSARSRAPAGQLGAAPRAGRNRARRARPRRGSAAPGARPPAAARRAHPLEHQPLVRGMLVDDHQPVLGLGDDIGRRDLAARDAERDRWAPARWPARRARRAGRERSFPAGRIVIPAKAGVPLSEAMAAKKEKRDPLSRG
jgi:hypothetical protein